MTHPNHKIAHVDKAIGTAIFIGVREILIFIRDKKQIKGTESTVISVIDAKKEEISFLGQDQNLGGLFFLELMDKENIGECHNRLIKDLIERITRRFGFGGSPTRVRKKLLNDGDNINFMMLVAGG